MTTSDDKELPSAGPAGEQTPSTPKFRTPSLPPDDPIYSRGYVFGETRREPLRPNTTSPAAARPQIPQDEQELLDQLGQEMLEGIRSQSELGSGQTGVLPPPAAPNKKY